MATLERVTLHRDPGGRGLTTSDRLALAFRELGVSPAPDSLERVVREVEELGAEIPPRPVPDAREVLVALEKIEALAGRYRIGLVSDTGLTPGRALRRVMEADGLARHFSAFGFSDETGWSKPAPGAFAPVLDSLGASPEEAVHVGDLAATDVAGALALGMGAVWLAPAEAARREATPGEAGEGDAALVDALARLRPGRGITEAERARLVRVKGLADVPDALRCLAGRR